MNRYISCFVLALCLLQGCNDDPGGSDPDANAAPIIDDPDGDGISSSDELKLYSSDPNDPNSPVRFGDQDHDGDGLVNAIDSDYSGDADDDFDGLSNDWEYSHALNPAEAEILIDQQRFFSVLTQDYSWIRLQLKTPLGTPIAGTAFHVYTDSPALIRPIYSAKGWVSNADGVIQAPLIALGTGESTLYLRSPDKDIPPIAIAGIHSSLQSQQHNPDDTQRLFSSVRVDTSSGLALDQSMLGSTTAWTPENTSDDHWIELPVNADQRVHALLAQGRADAAEWVTGLKISYEIAPGLREYANDGFNFNANSDRNTITRIPFDVPEGVRSIRVHPSQWFFAPSMRIALETSTALGTSSLTMDSDGDGFSDVLEQRIGSLPDDAQSPQLYNPTRTERAFSSHTVTTTNDQENYGAVDGITWKPATEDHLPWTSMQIPSGSRLVGVQLQGSNNSGVTSLELMDASVPGLTTPLHDTPQDTPHNNQHLYNQWLTSAHGVSVVRLYPQAWQQQKQLRAALWIVDASANAETQDLYADGDGDGLNTLEEHALGLDQYNPDSDLDTLLDGEEIDTGGNPLQADSDDDGLPDNVEKLLGSDPNDSNSPGAGNAEDPDMDGLNTAFELSVLHTDPNQADTDADGLSDFQESRETFTNPLTADSDGDTLSDSDELVFSSNPNLYSSPLPNPTFDTDGDGLNNVLELFSDTDNLVRDSDGDKLNDGQEYNLGSDPLDANSPVADGAIDTDGDGLSAAQEFARNSDAENPHSPLAFGAEDLDQDGWPNAVDVDYIENGDFDGDGLENQFEYDTGNDPRNPDSPALGGDTTAEANSSLDSDNDGLDNTAELMAGFDPANANSPVLAGGEDLDGDGEVNAVDPDYDPQADADGDSWSNSFEYRHGTDPATATEFSSFPTPVVTRNSATDALIHSYTLEAPAGDQPFYAANPQLLDSITVVGSSPVVSARDPHAGFNSEDISYVEQDGTAFIINNTPRRFSSLGIRNTVTRKLSRVQSDILPFSQVALSATVDNAEVIRPNPLGVQSFSALQTLNNEDGSERVLENLVDDVHRVAIGHKLHLNQTEIWLRYTTLGTDPASSSEQFSQLLYDEASVAFSLLSLESGYPWSSWSNRVALHASELSDYQSYHQSYTTALGFPADGDFVNALYSYLPQGSALDLNAAQARGSTWIESATLYTLIPNAASNTLRLSVFSEQDISSVHLFSETLASLPPELSYDASNGEFVIELSDTQWASQRLAVLLDQGTSTTALALTWGEGQTTWQQDALLCADNTVEPCHP